MDDVLQRRRLFEKRQKAIRDGGFYDHNGCWNSIRQFYNDNNLYRERVETIIIKDNKEIFVKRRNATDYFLPGGSTEKNVSHIDQALAECHEETHYEVRDLQFSGYTYKDIHNAPEWAKRECEITWDGSYTEIYVGRYNGKYEGTIEKKDEDPFIRSGQWYSLQECMKFFRKEHRDAMLEYLKYNTEEEEVATESYLSNYFSNIKFFKKIGAEPDMQRSAVNQILDAAKKEYVRLKSTSKILHEMKKADVGDFFHPFMMFEFPDKKTITFGLNFDVNEFTPAAAYHDYVHDQDLVIIYPKFFGINRRESLVYILLHEIGHIRLKHVYGENYRGDGYRVKLMKKGKAMYPEVNADLYAVLNGAVMYGVLDLVEKTDIDPKTGADLRPTNAELSYRYNQVFRKYNKYHKESDETFNMYDIACMTVYEKTYLNKDTDYLSNSEKDELYAILYEFAINKKFINNKDIQGLEEELVELIKSFKETYKDYINPDKIDRTFVNPDIDVVIKDGVQLDDETAEKLSNMYEDMVTLYNIINKKKSDYYEYAIPNDVIFKNNTKAEIMAIKKDSFISEMTEEIESIKYQLMIKNDNIVTEAGHEIYNHYLYVIESLSSAERKKIPLEKFGIPEERKYPLDTERHVRSAIILFPKCQEKYREELATNIFKAMKEFNIPMDVIGKDTLLYTYIPKDKK